MASEVFTLPWLQQLAGFHSCFHIRSLPGEMTGTLRSHCVLGVTFIALETSLNRFRTRRNT